MLSVRLPEQECGQGHGQPLPGSREFLETDGEPRRQLWSDVDRTNHRTANHGADQSARELQSCPFLSTAGGPACVKETIPSADQEEKGKEDNKRRKIYPFLGYFFLLPY